MAHPVLKALHDRLTADKIPARLLEEDDVLTVLLAPPVLEGEMFGDIYFVTYGGDPADNGFLMLEWEVADLSGFSDESQANLCVGLSLMNTILPAGGYAVRAEESEEEDADPSVPARTTLLYRLSLPVGLEGDEEWLEKETYEAVNTSAAVLKSTASSLLDFAQGKMGQDAFMRLVT